MLLVRFTDVSLDDSVRNSSGDRSESLSFLLSEDSAIFYANTVLFKDFDEPRDRFSVDAQSSEEVLVYCEAKRLNNE